MKIFFSDFFDITPDTVKKYGAFDISLINDLPLFIDPFLLFDSPKAEYQALHQSIIKYIAFLRDKSDAGAILPGLVKHWFMFPEIKQNWLGYSKIGNGGSGLGQKFARSLNNNIAHVFENFGADQITKGNHLEKLSLIQDGVGKDNISDFTTNLINGFLCEYTQNFAEKHLQANRLKEVEVKHAAFDFDMGRWKSRRYKLPFIDGDYVLLTPRDILTKDEAWINKNDIIADFDDITASIPNEELRDQINSYLLSQIPEKARKSEVEEAKNRTLKKYPAIIDYFVKSKEEKGAEARNQSIEKVAETEEIFIRQVKNLVEALRAETLFYKQKRSTFDEAYKRLLFLKQVIESNDGYKLFYVKGQPLKRESDLQTIFRLTWFAAPEDVNSEVNNGRGPVDYKISRGAEDSTLIEFKLASNSKLAQNLKNQVEVYKEANRTPNAIKVILYFNDTELNRLLNLFTQLGIKEGKELILIDARDNKISASNVK